MRPTLSGSHTLNVPSGYILFARRESLLAQRFDPKTFTIAGDPVLVADGVSYDDLNKFSAFSSSKDLVAYVPPFSFGKAAIQWLDRSGRSVGTVGRPGVIGSVALSHDGKSFAFNMKDAQ